MNHNLVAPSLVFSLSPRPGCEVSRQRVNPPAIQASIHTAPTRDYRILAAVNRARNRPGLTSQASSIQPLFQMLYFLTPRPERFSDMLPFAPSPNHPEAIAAASRSSLSQNSKREGSTARPWSLCVSSSYNRFCEGMTSGQGCRHPMTCTATSKKRLALLVVLMDSKSAA